MWQRLMSQPFVTCEHRGNPDGMFPKLGRRRNPNALLTIKGIGLRHEPLDCQDNRN